MPVRTVTEEFCDICFTGGKAKSTPATERVRFSWLGKDYLVLACARHIDEVRNPLQRLSEIGSVEGRARRSTGRPAGPRQDATSPRTRFSQLTPEEKKRFRAWAGLPNARRIADARVEEWMKAGRR